MAAQPEEKITQAGPGPGDGQLRILHHGRHYIVRHFDAAPDDDVIINFEYWRPTPTLQGEFSGEGFFRHRGMSAIGVMAAENDWYQQDEILDVIAAIRAAVPGRRLIGYGGSMGGYGVINFADLLGLQSLVAVIPQYSIDPARAPYETRWREEAARITFRHDRIDRAPPIARGYLVYDPWCVDGQHARDILRHHALRPVRLYFGGHDQFQMLQQANLLTPMLLDMLAQHFDEPAFRRAWRVQRRQAACFWLELGGQLAWRGRIAAAREASRRGRALPHRDPQAFIDLDAAIDQADAHFAARRADHAASKHAAMDAGMALTTDAAAQTGVLPQGDVHDRAAPAAQAAPRAGEPSRWQRLRSLLFKS